MHIVIVHHGRLEIGCRPTINVKRGMLQFYPPKNEIPGAVLTRACLPKITPPQLGYLLLLLSGGKPLNMSTAELLLFRVQNAKQRA